MCDKCRQDKAALDCLLGEDVELLQVREMHEHFDLGVERVPTLEGRQPLLERIHCLQEELNELTTGHLDRDLPGIADALIDLVVFAKGTAVQLGLPWAALFDDVMRANLAKVRGVGKRGHVVDLVKPPGWRGPQTADILRAHGWVPPTDKGDK
jgi:hypothetical protein